MKIRKCLAFLLAFSLLPALSACGRFAKGDSAPLAPMEPLQGGFMLYPFYGHEPYRTLYGDSIDAEYPLYPIGLINQDSKLVSPPVYHRAWVIYDEAERGIIGGAFMKDREITIYKLDGKSRVLPIEGCNIYVYPGGRYAAVNVAQFGNDVGGEYIEPPEAVGLYDLRKDKFVIEPKEGQTLNLEKGGFVLSWQYDTPDLQSEEISQWAYSLVDNKKIDLPYSMGYVQQYFPEAGWFSSIWTEGEFERRVYDKNLQLIPALTGWSMDYAGFNGGEWCIIYDNEEFPGLTTWVNRKGELSDKSYTQEVQLIGGGTGYLVWDPDNTILLDADLNVVSVLEAGERFICLENSCQPNTLGGTGWGILHLNADGSIKAAYDFDTKPMQTSAEFSCWKSFGYDVIEHGAYTLYAAKDGEWAALDLGQFQPEPKQVHRDGIPYAGPLVMCEDYIVVETGVYWHERAPVVYEVLVLDWQGQPIDTCPLQPYLADLTSKTAGEQGPMYYWLESGGKRGYINTKGEWLFIDES